MPRHMGVRRGGEGGWCMPRHMGGLDGEGRGDGACLDTVFESLCITEMQTMLITLNQYHNYF